MDQTYLVYRNDVKDRLYLYCKFHDPWVGLVLERGHISHTVKMHYFFENFLLYSGAWVRQTKYIHVVMVKMGGSTKIVTFVTFFVLGCGLIHVSHIITDHHRSLKRVRISLCECTCVSDVS